MTDDPRRDPSTPTPREGTTPPRSSGITDGNLADTMELAEFMERLGMVFNLPGRRERPLAAVAAAPAKPASAPRARRVPAAFLLALLLLTAAAGYFVLRPSRGTDPLPPEAVGRWTTTDPQFADRGFDLTATTVTFHTGPGPADFTRHAVLGTTVKPQQGRQIVTVAYALDGDAMTFAFRLEEGREPEIHLMNRQDVSWRKAVPNPAH